MRTRLEGFGIKTGGPGEVLWNFEKFVIGKNGQVVARPMMYLALSYDHRIVDGKEAVTFLVRVKECLEDPQRFILEL